MPAFHYHTVYRLFRRLVSFLRSLKRSTLHVILAFVGWLKKCNMKSWVHFIRPVRPSCVSPQNHSNPEVRSVHAYASSLPGGIKGSPDILEVPISPGVHSMPMPNTFAPCEHMASLPRMVAPGEHIRLVPCIASDVQRYHKNVFLEPRSVSVIIPAFTQNFPAPTAPHGWNACVHPDGALYFIHPVRRAITDANLYQHATLASIDTCLDHLMNTAHCLSMNIAHDVELMLQLASLDGEQVCGYYFVNHKCRTLFWIQEMPADSLSNGVEGLDSLHHFRYAIEAEYWLHCELYPTCRIISQALVNELQALLLVAYTENLTSSTSLFPFSGKELKDMLDLMPNIDIHIDDDSHPTWVIARIMGYFARAKFFNFCGQPFARLDADQSVYNSGNGPSWIATISSWCINIFLFGGPHAYMSELRKIWVDHTISSVNWKDFNERLSSQWTSLALYATVILVSDVTLWALSVVNDQSKIAIISVEMSIYCIVGSQLVSIMLSRRIRKDGGRPVTETVAFLLKATKPFFGIGILAMISVIYSLPHAMLTWGLCLFIFAFSAIVFQTTSLLSVYLVYCFGIIIFVSISISLSVVYQRQLVGILHVLLQPVYVLHRLIHLPTRPSLRREHVEVRIGA